MYRRILVPTDFSEYAERALAHATGLARQVGAELILFHSFARPLMPSLHGVDQSLNRYLDEAVSSISKKLEDMAEACEGVKARAITREGKPAEEIITIAKDENCDLICLSTHGHGSLAHVILGGTAEKVIKRSPCPLLVLKVNPPVKRRTGRWRRKAKQGRRVQIRTDEDGIN